MAEHEEPGPGRELSRQRSNRRQYVPTGRRHHLGAPPDRMPVYGEDGAIVGSTRTSPPQLAAMTPFQLASLDRTLRSEMAAAAAAEEYEEAAGIRDELGPLTTEIGSRQAT